MSANDVPAALAAISQPPASKRALDAHTMHARKRSKHHKHHHVKYHAPTSSASSSVSSSATDRDVRDVVTPLWRTPYADQLQLKLRAVRAKLETFARDVRSDAAKQSAAASLHWPHADATSDLPCPLLGIVASPVVDYYRNKCEFPIGVDAQRAPTVGFNGGRFIDGQTSVVAPDACVNVPAHAKHLAALLTAFLRSDAAAPLGTPFDKYTHAGVWRLLSVRSATTTGECMCIVQVQGKDATATTLAAINAAIVELFAPAQLGGAPLPLPDAHRVVSVCVQVYDGVSNAAPTDLPVTQLYPPIAIDQTADATDTGAALTTAEPHITERLLGLEFRIAPSAFFQTNSLGAERLYSAVVALCDLRAGDTLLDVCCGTGTIGHIFAAGTPIAFDLVQATSGGDGARGSGDECGASTSTAAVVPSASLLSSSAEHARPARVVGFELCAPAVENARANAARNCIADVCSYHTGKAEDTLPQFLQSLPKKSAASRIVAVVDPPRGGLHPSVLKALRRCTAIDALVYVSCNPATLVQDMQKLTLPVCAKLPGIAFHPVRALAVDMFPHTEHCEMVVQLTR